MKLSLVIPFIDQVDITKHCIEVAAKNAGQEFELVLIDNGSDKRLFPEAKPKGKAGHYWFTPDYDVPMRYLLNKENIGVLPTFKQAFENTDSDIICFIHNDVLLHEENWVQKVIDAFTAVPKLGLAGIFGAVGVGDNGGRIRSQSKMLGLEWGKCECHEVAWQHHSEFMDGVSPATILDGVGMFFSREAANSLLQTDIFDDWRAPHHFYDRIIPLKLIDRGFRIATIGLGFDHWSGATANSSDKYQKSGMAWLKRNGHTPLADGVDHTIYTIAENQFFYEFGHRIPCYVHADWNYEWRGVA